MLLNTKTIVGHKLAATDGDIGKVKDFYFDDKSWALRYVVADTGTWLTGRQVLLSPYSFGLFDQSKKVLQISLTRQQIENSPSIDAHRPVSRQYEENYYNYFGWPLYWKGGNAWGARDYPGMLPSMATGNLRSYPPAGAVALHLLGLGVTIQSRQNAFQVNGYGLGRAARRERIAAVPQGLGA